MHSVLFATSTCELLLLNPKGELGCVYLPTCIVNIALQKFGRVKRLINKSQFVLLNPLNILILVSFVTPLNDIAV